MKKPMTIPRPPRVVLFRQPKCKSADRALELLGYTGAKVDVRDLGERGLDEAEQRALGSAIRATDAASSAASGADLLARELERAERSLVLLPDAGRASVLDAPERALELFAIPLPEGETEGSLMRRVLQNRLV